MKIWMVDYRSTRRFYGTLNEAVERASAEAEKQKDDFDIREFTFAPTREVLVSVLNGYGVFAAAKERVVFTARWTGKGKADAM